VIEFLPVRIKAGLNIPQTLPASHLCVSKAEELVKGRESLDPIFATVSFDTEIELVSGKKLKKLLKYRYPGIHGHLL
jgi:hypothetical protein